MVTVGSNNSISLIKTKEKLLSAVSIALNSLTAASIYTYPVFSPALQSQLKFSVQQVSATVSIVILLQYISSAIWGAFSDRYGARRVSFLAAILFFCGYSGLMHFIKNPTPGIDHSSIYSWICVTLAFSLCGMATAASYFAAITASAKTFGSSHPSLSIAGPSSLLALGPLLYTFLAAHYFITSDKGFDTVAYLRMLAYLSLVVNLLGAFSLRSEIQAFTIRINERTSLLSETYVDNSNQLSSPIDSAQDCGTFGFISKPTVWLFGFAVLLTSGPAEMTLSSIGYVVDAYDPSAGVEIKAKHIQLISIANTASRVIMGYLSDRLCGQGWGGRLTFLTLAPFTYCLVCLCFGLGGKCLWLLSLFTGICYGTLFALAPSLVAIVWPLKSFGRNFGIISYFAATGSFLFTLVFGILFEEEPVKRHGDINTIIRVAKFQKSSIESVQKVYRAVGIFFK
ncbi:major facilitator superfamily domain-containing protein [Phakopsora pachyrhizi]|nr:major facilitator superfamily domain-containing protein [Phakopsora pachyrhizi]